MASNRGRDLLDAGRSLIRRDGRDSAEGGSAGRPTTATDDSKFGLGYFPMGANGGWRGRTGPEGNKTPHHGFRGFPAW